MSAFIAGSIVRGLGEIAISKAGGSLPTSLMDPAGVDFSSLINTQLRVQRETLWVNLQTNVIKAHHDARMSAVRNMRS